MGKFIDGFQVLALLAGMSLFSLSACAQSTDQSLAGLWYSHEVLAPTLSGTVTLHQQDGTWTAALAGQSVQGTANDEWIWFTFDDGSLRVRPRESGAPAAFWIQPPRMANHTPYATPVRLHREAGSWHGEVTPLADEFTLYLSVTDTPDGQDVFIRNPDRNIGMFLNLSALEAEGDSVTLIGQFRGEDSEPYPLASGTRTGADTITLTIDGLGQTHHFTRLAEGAASDFHPSRTPNAPYTYSPPAPQDDGWPVADAREMGIDPAGLEALVEAINAIEQTGVRAPYPHAIIVARHGQLIFEEYFHGADADVRHDTRSSSKSLSTTMVGVMMEAGAPISPGDSVAEVLGEPNGDDPRAAALTIEHLMTMSSGLDCDDGDTNSPGNEDVMQNQTTEPDWYRYTLDLDFVRDPGTEAVYCSAGLNLLGAALSAATGEWGPTLVDEYLAQPLQWGMYHMNLMPTGEAYFGGGLHIAARDFMKLGQLMLNDGVWNGERILPAGWAAAATTPYFPMNSQHYGYGWWLIDYPYDGGSVEAFYSGGNGGQMVINVPALDLVVMVNAGNYGDFANLLALRDDFVGRYIIPSVVTD